MENLYIVIPAYNEEKNIESVAKSWLSVLKGKSQNSRLVVADSGSTDRTREILFSLKKKFSQLEILEETPKEHGPKVIALYNWAQKNGADYVFQTDSDGQTNAAEFEAFWKRRGEFDAIFGERKIRGDGKVRAFVEKVVCFLLKIYFGVKVPDANAPFRLMKVSTLKKYLCLLPPLYNLPNIMLVVFFAKGGEKILFKEISFKPRQAGKNSVNIFRIIKIGIKALGDFKMFKKEIKNFGGEK